MEPRVGFFPRPGTPPSSEGRLAWPQAPSPSGHLCKPPRPTQPRVALFSAPRWLTDTHRRKPETRSHTPPRRSCSSGRSGCCSWPSGRCRAGCSRTSGIRPAAVVGIRARSEAWAPARRRGVAGSIRRRRADPGAFRRSGVARGAHSRHAFQASLPSSGAAAQGSRRGRSRRRSTARMPPRFFALV